MKCSDHRQMVGNKQGEAYKDISFLLWESFWVQEKEEVSIKPYESKRQSWEWKETNAARIFRTGNQRRENCTKKECWRCVEVPIRYSAECWPAHGNETTWGQGKSHLKRLGGRVSAYPIKLRTVPTPASQKRKLVIHGSSGRVFRKGWVSHGIKDTA